MHEPDIMRLCNEGLVIAFFAGTALAQTPTPDVHIPVTVTSSSGIIVGLKQESFRLYEDGKEQQIIDFSSKDAPKSVGLLIDSSGSMTSKMDTVRKAAARFIASSGKADEFFLVAFSETPQLLVDFTGSQTEMEAGLTKIGASHFTALLDGLYFGIEKMRNAKRQRKVLLVITDGVEDKSQHSERELTELARQSDVEIYSIGISDPYAVRPEELIGPALLGKLCEETGGLMFRVDDVRSMSDIAQTMSIEMRNQYLIGFTPHDPGNGGRWRKVKVKVIRPKGSPTLTVHARTGYYAPMQ